MLEKIAIWTFAFAVAGTLAYQGIYVGDIMDRLQEGIVFGWDSVVSFFAWLWSWIAFIFEIIVSGILILVTTFLFLYFYSITSGASSGSGSGSGSSSSSRQPRTFESVWDDGDGQISWVYSNGRRGSKGGYLVGYTQNTITYKTNPNDNHVSTIKSNGRVGGHS